MKLDHLKELAIRAHNGTSFSPEKRGENLIKEFSEELEEDLKTPGIDASYYEAAYIKYLTSWLHAKGRCISSMITGPSRFPTARAEKYNNWEQNKYNEFREWREKALKRAEKVSQPVVDPLQEAKNKLANCESLQVLMKKANAVIRKGGTIEDLVKVGLSEKLAKEALVRGWWGIGFAPFQLTNNNAEIKRLKARIVELEKRTTGISTETDFPGGKLVENREQDRIQIIFDEKPNKEVIAILKSKAFHWSPFNKAWQRILTNNAIKEAKGIISNLQV